MFSLTFRVSGVFIQETSFLRDSTVFKDRDEADSGVPSDGSGRPEMTRGTCLFSKHSWKQYVDVMGYETSKLITSDTDLERGNAQRERRKIATTC